MPQGRRPGGKIVGGHIDKDIYKVLPDAPASDLFAMLGGSKNYPVAVVNQDDHLLGVIVVGSLLSKLAETTQGENVGNVD